MKIFCVINIIEKRAVFVTPDKDRAEEYILNERMDALKEANEKFSYNLDNLTEEELRDLTLAVEGCRAYDLRVFPIKLDESDETVTVTDEDGELITMEVKELLEMLKESEENR